MIKSTSTLSFNKRLELFNKDVVSIKDYTFSTTTLLIESTYKNSYIIKEKIGETTNIIDTNTLKYNKEVLHDFYFLLCEIVLSYIRSDETKIAVRSRVTPINFIVLKEEKEVWFDLYKSIHQESMSHLYVLKL